MTEHQLSICVYLYTIQAKLKSGQGANYLLKTPCCVHDVCVKCVEDTAHGVEAKCQSASQRKTFGLMPCVLCNFSWTNTPKANAMPRYKDKPFDDIMKARCHFLIIRWDITLSHMTVDKRVIPHQQTRNLHFPVGRDTQYSDQQGGQISWN